MTSPYSHSGHRGHGDVFTTETSQLTQSHNNDNIQMPHQSLVRKTTTIDVQPVIDGALGSQ
jgi:hypothetical protein